MPCVLQATRRGSSVDSTQRPRAAERQLSAVAGGVVHGDGRLSSSPWSSFVPPVQQLHWLGQARSQRSCSGGPEQFACLPGLHNADGFKSGNKTLTAGKHYLRVDYFQVRCDGVLGPPDISSP